MRWHENLYISEKASHEKLKRFGKMRKDFSFPAYFITMPSNNMNLLDILSSHELFSNPYYKDAYIIGIAYGKADATELAKDVIWDVYRNTGQFNIKEYLNISGI